jgi:hypothetical protein
MVGWYLMMPPQHMPADLAEASHPPRLSHLIDRDAPVPKWEIVQSYDSAAECERGRSGWLKFAKADKKNRGRTDYIGRGTDEAYMAALCIATDDPRLKGK